MGQCEDLIDPCSNITPTLKTEGVYPDLDVRMSTRILRIQTAIYLSSSRESQRLHVIIPGRLYALSRDEKVWDARRPVALW